MGPGGRHWHIVPFGPAFLRPAEVTFTLRVPVLAGRLKEQGASVPYFELRIIRRFLTPDVQNNDVEAVKTDRPEARTDAPAAKTDSTVATTEAAVATTPTETSEKPREAPMPTAPKTEAAPVQSELSMAKSETPIAKTETPPAKPETPIMKPEAVRPASSSDTQSKQSKTDPSADSSDKTYTVWSSNPTEQQRGPRRRDE